MSRPATSRLKCNPPLGRMPVLQMMLPAELAIDPSYQRSIEASDSQKLIARIAVRWSWDLCQPLVVSRRFVRPTAALLEAGTAGDEPAASANARRAVSPEPSEADASRPAPEGEYRYYVIDGQHRLAAARLRGDIPQLPCVVVEYASAADEAASFVHLNQQRRPLGKLDVFKAAVASEDPRAVAITQALADAGFSLAPHTNPTVWKPGMVGNVGGIEQAWDRHGPLVTREALQCLAAAFAGEVLAHAGTLFPGIVMVCAAETKGRADFAPARFASFTAKLGAHGQDALRDDVLLEMATETGLGRVKAAIRVVTELWWPERKRDRMAGARVVGGVTVRAAHAALAGGLKLDEDGKAWCAQCDRRVKPERAAACGDRFCTMKAA